MFDKQEKLEVSRDELAVIEAALHTQAKILNVQASAGGNAARRRLNEVKRALAHITRQTQSKTTPTRRGLWGWLGMTRAQG